VYFVKLLSSSSPDDLRLVSIQLQSVAAHPGLDSSEASSKLFNCRRCISGWNTEVRLSVVALHIAVRNGSNASSDSFKMNVGIGSGQLHDLVGDFMMMNVGIGSGQLHDLVGDFMMMNVGIGSRTVTRLGR